MMAMNEMVYTYDETKNPEGAYLAGVPLRDLTVEDVAALPEWLQRSVAACSFYQPAKKAKTVTTATATAVKDGE